MNESEREQILDRRIQRRLATDSAYRYAENAEDQANREDEIEAEEDAKLPAAKECYGHPAGPSDPMGETVYCDGSCS